MITAISIENFKGIGEKQKIELRPITLLFGANSTGKSTILHALLYAQEIFARRNYDAGQTARGGEFVDLGGFCNFVHNRDAHRNLVLRLELDMDYTDLPSFDPELGTEVDGFPDDRFKGLIESAYVEITVRWSRSMGRPYCSIYEVGINEDRIGKITYEPGQAGAGIEVNREHPLWSHLEYDVFVKTDDSGSGFEKRQCKGKDLLTKLQSSIHTSDASGDALPDWQSSLNWGFANEFVPIGGADRKARLDAALYHDISRLLVGPGQAVRDEVLKFDYLGPLRDKPARNYEPPRYPDPSRWSSGLGGWDELQVGDETLTNEVSEWLGRADRLSTGYTLQRISYRELDVSDPSLAAVMSGRGFDEADLEDAKMALARSPIRQRLVLVADGSKERLMPHDVGEGISQVIPVVVAILGHRKKSVMIEQPELHVHPAVQTGLGDLLIEGLRDRDGIMLIETHSEHLLLRLLRRVREATAKTLPDGHFGLIPDQLAVYYLDTAEQAITARQLRVTEDGEFLDRWPKGFFEERIDEI